MTPILTVLGLLVTITAAREAGPQGIFELRLKQFRNFHASDINGNCCQPQNRFGSSCTGRCETKFRVCLKHYQTVVDLNQGCTFGEEITPVLGSNNLTINRPPIKFDINFKWPVGFIPLIQLITLVSASLSPSIYPPKNYCRVIEAQLGAGPAQTSIELCHYPAIKMELKNCYQ